ncbi:hypothetical protein Pmani_002563 [Petrolisthes manimaculis]|uniref:Uncharacterized protein n=1 Tax=Petrolisthes manimaculis TaxID=1843537 RepID=A0AAE1UQB9_9EUCA|nr:hypothetical protein Pmani_002563 [Petrolisthes manimaculis]
MHPKWTPLARPARGEQHIKTALLTAKHSVLTAFEINSHNLLTTLLSNMKLAVIFCVLSVAAMGSIEALSVHANDVYADVISKNLDELVHKAQADGGSIKDRYMQVDLAFYPLARALVYLQSATGQINDAPTRIENINNAERLDIRMFNNGP